MTDTGLHPEVLHFSTIQPWFSHFVGPRPRSVQGRFHQSWDGFRLWRTYWCPTTCWKASFVLDHNSFCWKTNPAVTDVCHLRACAFHVFIFGRKTLTFPRSHMYFILRHYACECCFRVPCLAKLAHVLFCALLGCNNIQAIFRRS